ncbi:hormone-sensitive lipase [Caerostris extrusa]|uniref:Hormone-sensitive lipase n=1 Tax=Caerostris extrusa TaxID=172846 RepID=A0AAV4YCM1_CAEEX|nr:hormone-sensitive lipase [Caerostris extrusa]
MATFSDLYQKSGGPLSKAILTILNGIKYIIDPELRALQIVDVAQNSSVEFLKAFWSLSEIQLMKQLPGLICPKLEVREEILVPDKAIILNKTSSNENVEIPAPTSHIPSAPVRCLLLSSVHRKGQVLKNGKSKMSNLEPKSRSLLFHCHGGGFVSQNPKSHEIYLRHWAHDLNVPILSVDYSLSPEAPFPRALEEVLLTYAWVLKNPDKLGWTGEIICFAGDSAGGNILMSVVLKTITLKIRQPDAVMCCYTPLVLDLVPSPSRLLCWVDPLLPLGFMISCLNAYAGTTATEDEYDVYDHQSGQRSRKISSISEIIDSILKDCTFAATNYVDDFIEKYGSEVDQKCQTEDISCNKEFTIYNFPHDIIFDIKTKCQKAANMGFNKISEIFMSTTLYQRVISPLLPSIEFPSKNKKQPKCDKNSSVFRKLQKLKLVSKNPFMSPLLASDDILKQMPPIHFVSLNFDPCLDDSITFAKRLKSLNRKVEIDFLDGLPHGFLNFLPFSQEAHDGSNLLLKKLHNQLIFAIAQYTYLEYLYMLPNIKAKTHTTTTTTTTAAAAAAAADKKL